MKNLTLASLFFFSAVAFFQSARPEIEKSELTFELAQKYVAKAIADSVKDEQCAKVAME